MENVQVVVNPMYSLMGNHICFTFCMAK